MVVCAICLSQKSLFLLQSYEKSDTNLELQQIPNNPMKNDNFTCIKKRIIPLKKNEKAVKNETKWYKKNHHIFKHTIGTLFVFPNHCSNDQRLNNTHPIKNCL